MIVFPQTLMWLASVQIQNGTVIFAIILNFMDPVLVGDPSIQHPIITDWKECFDGFLPGAHFLDKYNEVAQFLLPKVSVGDNEPTCKNNWGTTWLYWWSSLHRRQLPSSICEFVVPVIPYEFEIPRHEKRSTGSICWWNKVVQVVKFYHVYLFYILLWCVVMLLIWRMKLRTLSAIESSSKNVSFQGCRKRTAGGGQQHKPGPRSSRITATRPQNSQFTRLYTGW